MPVLLYAPGSAAMPSFAAVTQLPDSLEEVTGLWLDAAPDALLELLPGLRRHAGAAHLPVFTRAAPPLAVAALADGRADDAGSAAVLAAAWAPSPLLLPGAAPAPALRLARYLYLRPGTCLRPLRDWRHAATYRYPLAEAFADDGDAAGLIAGLLAPGWLAPLRLVDRLRRCGHCHSTHLNYVDVCPQCHALGIVRTRFVHCFTCAHVAPEVRFQRDEQLVCPQCLTRLRHIGADYNRPMEQMHCLACEHMFMEALVLARCLACDHEDTPERLPVAPVHEYGLSDRGHQGAREGALALPENRLARPHRMDADTFAGLLDWQLGLARRDGSAHAFCLLGLRLEVPDTLAAHLGNVGLAQLLEAFAARLGALLRDTDLVSRPADLCFWLLLPDTGMAGVARLLERVAALAEDTRQPDAPPLQVRAAAFCAPANLSVGERASDLLTRLAVERDAPEA
ncbi:MAG: hypothetical protein K0Q68_2906 [Moraxellaceae bacterium]|jgi:GGDEF domain-containing protein|nr:hypothetical protein [Moraxellaceae bacterium]